MKAKESDLLGHPRFLLLGGFARDLVPISAQKLLRGRFCAGNGYYFFKYLFQVLLGWIFFFLC